MSLYRHLLLEVVKVKYSDDMGCDCLNICVSTVVCSESMTGEPSKPLGRSSPKREHSSLKSEQSDGATHLAGGGTFEITENHD